MRSKGLFLAGLLVSVGVQAADDNPGAKLYQAHCAQCHENPANRIPSTATLKKMTPQAIMTAMTKGPMKEQAAPIADLDRWILAKWLGTPAVTAIPAEKLVNLCATDSSGKVVAAGWQGWGGKPENWRFQSEGLTAADVPKLKLKWAFGLPNVSVMRSQVAVFQGRVYVGGDDGSLYSLDAATGCLHWAASASPVRSAIVIGRAGTRDALFFGDPSGKLFAIDALSGKSLWNVQVDPHPGALLTGAPAYYEGRLYVPVSSLEEAAAANPKYPCCTFRGSVVALDAATGNVAWRAYTIDEEAKPQSKTKDGRTMFGPSGAGVWASPTIDREKKRIYFATGDNYSSPTSDMSDALIALDLATGKRLWSKQFTKGDAYNISCDIPGKLNCPDSPGGDFDFGAAPILVDLPNHKRALLLGQKSGMLYAVDPDAEGKELWQARAGKGGSLGGIQWGPATDGQVVYAAVSDVSFVFANGQLGLDPAKGGGITAYQVGDGKRLWHADPAGCGDRKRCAPAQSGALTAIPDAVFSGSLDGHLRVYSREDGKVLWDFDTARPFETVNKVKANGGSLDAGGPVIANGMLFVTSGYSQYGGMPGNVLLAFTHE